MKAQGLILTNYLPVPRLFGRAIFLFGIFIYSSDCRERLYPHSFDLTTATYDSGMMTYG